jgi:hypothetical protein
MTLDELIAALLALRTDAEAGRMPVSTPHPDSGWEGEIASVGATEPDPPRKDGYVPSLLHRSRRVVLSTD